MTDPTLPPIKKGTDDTQLPPTPLSETEKFEDIFKTIDIDTEAFAESNKEPTKVTSPQGEQLEPQEPKQDTPSANLIPGVETQEVLQLLPDESLQNVPTENPEPPKAEVLQPQEKINTLPTTSEVVQNTPPGFASSPVEPDLTGIKDIGKYIAKAKESQAKKVTRLEAEDGTDLTKLPRIFAVVPHNKGDHKLIYTYDNAPDGLIDDPKKRTPGTSYIKNNELIYDVWVTMKKHPTLKNERNEPLDVWLIDSKDQLTQQLASIAIGKGGGTNFSAPILCTPTKPIQKKTPPSPEKKTTTSTMTPGAKATVTPSQPPIPPLKKESAPGLSPEAKKTIKDTMAQKDAVNTPPPSLSKNFPTKKTELPTGTLPTQKTFVKKETLPKAQAPEAQAPKAQAPEVKIPATMSQVVGTKAENSSLKQEKVIPRKSTPLPTNIPQKKPDLPPVPVETVPTPAKVGVAEMVTTPSEKVLPNKEIDKLPNEITLSQATAETKQADSIKEQIIGATPLPNEISAEEVLIVPTEHKETYGDIVDLDSIDAQEAPKPKTNTAPILDLEGLDAQFSPAAKKVVVHPKGSAFPLGTVLRIVGVIIVIGMARAMYTVMFPSVPTRSPKPTDTITGDTLPEKTAIVDDLPSSGNTDGTKGVATGTTGMPSKDEIEGPQNNTGDAFTFDELKAKLTAQQKEAQATANKAKLLNNKDAIKFSIVSIRKASEALKRIEDDPTITASELTDIATKVDLYLQEAELRIQ